MTGSMGAQGSQGATGPIGNYPGSTFRDLVTFSFTANNSAPGYPIATAQNLIVFFQPAALAIAYVGVVYSAIANQPVTASIGLFDMTNIDYSSVTLGTPIGPLATPAPSGGIFGTISVSEPNVLFLEVNTINLTPAGPYSVSVPGVGRPVGVRTFTNNGQRFNVLSIIIGFTAA
jgi:hypothetical protein